MNIVFDIGGTKMRFAKISDNNLSDIIVVNTPNSYIDAMAEISEIVLKISKGEKVKNFVGGIAGVLDKSQKKLLISPNLKDWVNRPIADDLSRLTGSNVFIKNDTDMVALGEANRGAGINYRVVAYLTFSTGIGGSLVIDKNLLSNNFGTEPGFQIIDSSNLRSLHSVAGTELKRDYGLLFKDIKDQDIRNKVMKDVVCGIHNTIIFWSPDVVVLGGGMTESFILEDIVKDLNKINLKFPELPEIKFAELNDFGGLYGSLEFVKKYISN
jgi:glucokinase